MTESHNTLHQAMEAVGGPSYGDLQEAAPTEVRAAWKAADARSRDLVQTCHSLKNDPKFTDEYKSKQAWTAYQNALRRITKERERARELLEKEVSYHEEMSVPRPKGERLVDLSSEKLLAAQNAASSLIRKVERAEKRAAKSGSPIGKPSLPNLLRDEYAKGIKTGGVEGATTCKAVLLCAEELGVDADEVLDPLREDKHREALDKARRYEHMRHSIGGEVKQPPWSHPRSASVAAGRGTARNKNVLLRERGQGASSGAPLFAGKRRRPWK